MLKKELRLKYKTLRKSLSEEAIEEKSMAIANKLLSIPLWQKTYFHVFLPITKNQEVNTEYLLHLLAGKDKEIILSKTDFENRTMTPYLLTDNTLIQKNQYHIPEPIDGIEVPASKIEVVFVPLLAFDKKGHRVGYGKGFYDKFLTECHPEVIKVGLSFFGPEEAIDDVFEDDVTLDFCVTPEVIYAF